MASPMEQFAIKEILPINFKGYDISFTNSSLCMVISALSVIAIFAFCLRKRELMPNRAQCVPESIYEFIYDLFIKNTGRDGVKYFSFIFTLFLFILSGNLLGLFPYSFTFTSHLAAVGTLSLLALSFNICVGIKKKKWGYLRTFLPKGVPWPLAPLIIPIELISLLSKPFSLSMRLVANMVVGHVVLKILAGFIVMMKIFGFIPLFFDGCIIIFEIFIACLQAYIYTILSCIYLRDALHYH